MAAGDELLRVEHLSISFPGESGRVRVVDDVSFTVKRNEILALVGESGSGKTVTATALLRLNRPPARIESGRILMDGQDLLQVSEARLQQVRGQRISMIFQSPRSSLNPLMKVGDQIARVFRIHQGLDRAAARRETVKMLREVGISDPEARAEVYPHQMSGGMCQRVMIAMALACKPDLLIADEPTTGLDVTIEAQIFDLIKDLQEKVGMSVLLITHDLGVVAGVCHRVAVMHGGHLVECGDVETLFGAHKHPYSDRLFGSLLQLHESAEFVAPEPVRSGIDFTTPGCRFASKCPQAVQTCFNRKPEVITLAPGHTVMCHLYSDTRPTSAGAESGRRA